MDEKDKEKKFLMMFSKFLGTYNATPLLFVMPKKRVKDKILEEFYSATLGTDIRYIFESFETSTYDDPMISQMLLALAQLFRIFLLENMEEFKELTNFETYEITRNIKERLKCNGYRGCKEVFEKLNKMKLEVEYKKITEPISINELITYFKKNYAHRNHTIRK